MKKNIFIVLLGLIITVLLLLLATHNVPSLIKGDIEKKIANKSAKTVNFCDSAISNVRYDHLGYEWIKVTCNAAFSARDGAGALVYKDAMWLLGGWNPSDKINFPKACNNEVWKSGDGLNWILIKANTFGKDNFDSLNDWEGRHGAGFVVFKNRMWIIGGDANQQKYQNDIWNSEDGVNWERILQQAPWYPRAASQVVVFNNKIWVFGGQTMDSVEDHKQQYFADAWSSENGKDWQHHIAGNTHWLPRGMIIGQAALNKKLWILGGATYSNEKGVVKNYYNDVWSTKNGADWKCELLQAPWEQRCYQNVISWDKKIWIIGGANGQFNEAWNRNDMWYSADGKFWQELNNIPWQSRHASSIYDFKGSLWIVSGNNLESDVWRLSKIKPEI